MSGSCVKACLGLVVAIAVSVPCAIGQDIDLFEKQVRPILANNCYACHGPDSGEGQAELRLDSLEGMLRGGRSGPALVRVTLRVTPPPRSPTTGQTTMAVPASRYRRPLACKAWPREAHLRRKSVSMRALYGSVVPVVEADTDQIRNSTYTVTYPLSLTQHVPSAFSSSAVILNMRSRVEIIRS